MTVDSASAPTPDTRPTSEILKDLLRAPFTIIWFVLIAATLLSWYLGADQGLDNNQATTCLIMIVSFIKVRFVGLYFMELRDAPTPLRSLFEVYCGGVCAMILVMYLMS